MADITLKTLHPFLQVNDTSVSSGGIVKSYSHDTGSGPILLLVHGYPQNSFVWRHCISALKGQFSLFIPELPGYGISSLPPAHDKRTVGRLILEAEMKVFGTSRPIILAGHDRGARVLHRLVVDYDHSIKSFEPPKILSAIFVDIVPTVEQFKVFSNPKASVAYFHWAFLATPFAPLLIEKAGGGVFVKLGLEKLRGTNDEGAALSRSDAAMANYCHQFNGSECIAGSCGDYQAGALIDCPEQEEDQKAGRKVKTPLLVVYSSDNLGKMHDADTIWRNWAVGPLEVQGIGNGYGHFLPEECPEVISEWVLKWAKQYAL